MAAAKSVNVIQNNVTLTGGAGPTTTSSVNIGTGFGASIFLKITNGATGPSVSAKHLVQVSADGTNFYDLNGGTNDLDGGTSNNDVTSKHIELPIGIKYVRVVATHGSDQNVTSRVEVSNVSAVV